MTMKKISEILRTKKVKKIEKTGKLVNEKYHQSLLLEKKFNLKFVIFLGLMKKYSFNEIMSVYSWWADYPLKHTFNIGLLIWKLKELYPNKENEKKKQKSKDL